MKKYFHEARIQVDFGLRWLFASQLGLNDPQLLQNQRNEGLDGFGETKAYCHSDSVAFVSTSMLLLDVEVQRDFRAISLHTFLIGALLKLDNN